jgi:hypothetical protein
MSRADSRFVGDINRAIRAAHRKHGRPPSCREAEAERTNEAQIKYQGAWADMLDGAGVPTRESVVARDINEQLAERHPWQDFIEVDAPGMAERTGISATTTGNALGKLSDGERTPDASEAFTIERRETSRRTKWRVRPVGEGGESA